MKRVSIFLLIFIFFSSEDGISQQINRKVYHTHQLGFEAGIGDNSAGGTRFPFGSSVGGFYRYKNYMFGFRRDFFSDLNIFSPTTYYKYINGYLAFAFQKKIHFYRHRLVSDISKLIICPIIPTLILEPKFQ